MRVSFGILLARTSAVFDLTYHSSSSIESLIEFICNENQPNPASVHSPELTSSMPMVPVLKESEQSISSFDKISQCNLDSEYAKSFLMFDEDDNFMDVRVPTRREPNRVYNIEDVACRFSSNDLE